MSLKWLKNLANPFSRLKKVFLKTPKKEALFINKQLTHYASDFQFLALDDFNLAYLERGQGPEKILFLHGMTEDSLNWFYTMEYLFIKSSSFHLFAMDLPGFGQTACPKNFKISIPAYLQVIEKFLDQKNIQQVTLIGHSLGGQTAISFAHHYPHRVKKLILVDSAGIRRFGTMASKFFQVLPVPGNLLKQVSFFDWFKLMTTGTLLKDKTYYRKMMYEIAMTRKNSLTEYFIERNFQQLVNGGLDRLNSIKEAMDAMLDSDEYADEKLPALNCPVDFIWGENDQMIPLRYGYRGYELISHEQKKFYVFRKTGHYPLLERPRDFSEVIFKFLIRA